jgi:type IV pilus assembly protein PilN
MMAFNLLPYRAQQRRRRLQRFRGVLLLAALLGGVFTATGLYAIDRRQQRQQSRNDWLQHARQELDAQIRRSAALQREIDALATRAGKIEMLRHRRGRTPHFLSTLAAHIPPGAYLQKMTQHDGKIMLDGYAASNQTVAELLQNLNAQTDSIASAQLLETRAENRQGPQQLAFSVALTLREQP